MHKYRLVSKKGEGTFSEVLKAQSIKTGKSYAIKCMKNHFDSVEQVNNLREIQALRRLAAHPNIIKLHEVLYDEPTGRLALVFELMEMNLYEAIKGRRHYLPELKVKQYMFEVLKALDYMHRNGIFHRDVKPENLLLLDDEIKLADLGSCRGIYSRQPFTEYISTRWYRAPECLLTDGYYNFKMDLFAAGCVWFEIVALFPLFPGKNEMDQIHKIHNVLGTPDPELLNRKFKRHASHMDFNFPERKGTGIEKLVPHADPELTELLKKLIKYDPDERALARQALKDSYFMDVREAEKERMALVQAIPQAAQVPTFRRNLPPPVIEVPGESQGGQGSSSSSACESPHDDPQAANESGCGPSEERNQGLPTIARERHEAGGGPGLTPRATKNDASSNANATDPSATGFSNEDSDEYTDTSPDGMLLPPIGGIKGNRGAQPNPKKARPLASLSNSKGFGGVFSGAAKHGGAGAPQAVVASTAAGATAGGVGADSADATAMAAVGAAGGPLATNFTKEPARRGVGAYVMENPPHSERNGATWAVSPSRPSPRKQHPAAAMVQAAAAHVAALANPQKATKRR